MSKSLKGVLESNDHEFIDFISVIPQFIQLLILLEMSGMGSKS